MKLPNKDLRNGGKAAVRYVFVADEVFPLKENLMCPFPGP